MLIVWPELSWIGDSTFLLAFLAIGAVITTLVFRYAVRRARREQDHRDDE